MSNGANIMSDFTKARKTTATHTVSLHCGGRPTEGMRCVSFRALKGGKPTGRTFTKQFDTEAEAEAFFNTKGE
jgi:hypothetical protein